MRFFIISLLFISGCAFKGLPPNGKLRHDTFKGQWETEDRVSVFLDGKWWEIHKSYRRNGQ